MSAQDHGGPAFPVQSIYVEDLETNSLGMTLRDYFAAKALCGLLAGLDRDARRFVEQQAEPTETMAKACYTMADAMLEARK